MVISGHLYVHFNCAIWSYGVIRKKEEKESPKDSKDPKDKKADDVANLENVLLDAIGQKCAHCKHYGASLRCRGNNSKFYHFPCGAASGSFMQKSTLTIVGTDSLSKVASIGKIIMTEN